MATIIEQKKFVMSNVGRNSNKVWQYTLYDDGSVACEWGRVGKGLQSKTFSGGKNYADKKAREKIRKGYKEVEVLGANSSKNSKTIAKGSLKDIATKQIKHTDPTVVKLIEYLTDVNAHNIYEATGGKITFNNDSGLFQTPIGIVSLDNVKQARVLLNDLAKAVQKQDFTSRKTIQAFEEYLMLVPQEVPRKLTIEGVLPDQNSVLSQNSLLDGLEASYASALNSVKDETEEQEKAPQVFDVALDLVNDGKVFDFINSKYGKTRNRMHSCYHLKVHKIYSVEISQMKDAFDKSGKLVGNIKKLWHGTRAANLLSILKGGFVIPPSNASHCTGRMFFNGVYFSNQSTKSLNYAYGYWGGSRDNNCFMFLCDVAMGKPYIPTSPINRPIPASYDSCWAKPNISGVQNHEMVVYKTSQINPVYLVEFKG